MDGIHLKISIFLSRQWGVLYMEMEQKEENKRHNNRWSIDAKQRLSLKFCFKSEASNQSLSKFHSGFKPVLNICAGGLSFRLECDDPLLFPGSVLEYIAVFSEEGDVMLDTTGEVTHVSYIASPESYYKVGVKFLKDNVYRRRSALNREHNELITSEHKILNILGELTSSPVLVKYIYCQKQVSLTGSFIALGKGEIPKIRILFKEKESNFDKYLESLRKFKIIKISSIKDENYILFDSVIIEREESHIIVRVPDELHVINQRLTSRYSVGKEEKIDVTINNPFFKEQAYRVRDIIPAGLSFEFDSYTEPFVRGMIFNDIKVTFHGHSPIKVSGKVTYTNRLSSKGNAGVCGIKFLRIKNKDMYYIVSYLMMKTYKGINNASGKWVERQLNMFYSTGFIYKEKDEFLRPIYEEVNDTLIKLSHEDVNFFKNIIIKENERILGTVSCVQLYEGTWMVQHLTSIKSNGKQFYSKEVAVAITDFCSKNPDVKYQKIFWRPNNSWADRIFGKYARSLDDRANSMLHLYHYMVKEISHNEKKDLAHPDMLLEVLQIEDAKEIESYFISTKQTLMLNAENFTKDKINFFEISDIYNKQELIRERRIFVIKEFGVFIGFAVAEYSSLGINFSGLLNCFRIYIKNKPKAGEEVARNMLISAATDYYVRKGRKFIICLASDNAFNSCEKNGFIKRKTYSCWTVHKKFAFPYMQYVKNLFKRFEKIQSRK